MAEVFLDSSTLIGLVFRHAGERTACQSTLPPGGVPVCSRYIIFEVARGFLRSLIALHNYSFEFSSFGDLHLAAYSGQRRFKPYLMHTWLGAFTDYFALLETEDGTSSEALKLEEFRAKLRIWIRRGWRQMSRNFIVINEIGCREDIPSPISRSDLRVDQPLPDGECGQPWACSLQTFIQSHERELQSIVAGLEDLLPKQKDAETIKRIAALRQLLETPLGERFEGKNCHRCGDALVCLEAPTGHVIATKNQKHFNPLASFLGKLIVVPPSAGSTR